MSCIAYRYCLSFIVGAILIIAGLEIIVVIEIICLCGYCYCYCLPIPFPFYFNNRSRFPSFGSSLEFPAPILNSPFPPVPPVSIFLAFFLSFFARQGAQFRGCEKCFAGTAENSTKKTSLQKMYTHAHMYIRMTDWLTG